MSAPPASNQDACAARRLWKVTPCSSLAFSTAGTQNFVRKLLRESAVPALDVNRRAVSRMPYSTMCLAFALAVRHEVLPRNPVDSVSRLHQPKCTPTALTPAEVNAVRAAIKVWEQTRGTCGPNPDGQLSQIVEVMLGTSARIGEVLAVRRCDIDVTVNPALMRIAGTVISSKGEPTFRQDHPKTNRSNRIVALPSFTAEALRQRLAVMADRSPEALVFASRNRTPLTTANVRSQLRKVLGDAGIDRVHPHMFRRTVATVSMSTPASTWLPSCSDTPAPR
jgi:integrase